MSQIDIKTIRQLADIIVEKDLNEIELDHEGHKIRLTRKGPQFINEHPTIFQSQVQALPSPQPIQETVDKNLIENCNNEIIKSPMVGTAYLSPDPDASPFIKVGDKVKKDQTLMIIEAMKVMNPLKSPIDGIVKEIFAKNTKPVEFGESLLILEKE